MISRIKLSPLTSVCELYKMSLFIWKEKQVIIMKQISVLVVEDSVYSADLNVREVRKAGFDVHYLHVESARAMTKALQEEQWDLILCDNSMVHFNAIAALAIRNGINASIPFILVSEDVSGEELQLAFQSGCQFYIAKENLVELRGVVSRILLDKEKELT